MDRCCTGCFQHPYLVQLITNEGSKKRKKCWWCGSFRLPSLEVGFLTDSFTRVVDTMFISYEDSARGALMAGSGDAIGYLLDDEFSTFSEDVCAQDRRDELALTILNGGQGAGEDGYDDDSGWIAKSRDWAEIDGTEGLSEAIAQLSEHVHRFGPGFAFATDRARHPATIVGAERTLERELRRQVAQVSKGTVLYRARIEEAEPLADWSQVGAPPASVARAGRVNQSGQPVLYVAADAETALAEVRPAIGDRVAIGTLKVLKRQRLCLLDAERIQVSPFNDVDSFQRAAELNRLRRSLGQALARPVRPSDTGRDYLFTQYLASTVRRLGFDGIAFPSSQRAYPLAGTNYAFFNPAAAVVTGVDRRVITRIEFGSRPA